MSDKTDGTKDQELETDSQTGIVPLGEAMTNLPEEQRVELQAELAKGLIEANTAAAKAGTEARSLKENLATVAGTSREATEAGSAVTVSHVQETDSSRTEVIMGNTERAESGKLTKSQSGEKDWNPYYIIGGIVAAALVAIAVANNL